jgi:Flp pilus assembly protein TadD
MLNQLLRQFSRKWSGPREVTPTEVRDLIDRGQLDAAWAALARLATATPKRAVTETCLRGEVEFRRHHDAEAEALFREALKEEPGLPDAHYGLSLLMLARGEMELALRHATFASSNSQDARMSAQLGLCNLEMKDFVRAAKALSQATRLDPNDKSSWNNLGIARRALGDGEGARAAFARALQLDPRFDRARINAELLEGEIAQIRAASGVVEPEDGESDKRALALDEIVAAIDRCEQLCIDEPANAKHVIELADLYRLQGDAQSGEDALRAFLARHPDDIDVVSALGRSLVQHRNFREGLTLVERALTVRPDDVDLLLSKAAVRNAQDRLDDAGALIERAFELQPTFHNKGRLAANLGARCKYEDSLRMVTEMAAERPAAARDVLGIKLDALIALGRHDESLPELDALIESNPNDPNFRFLRASINLLRENFELGWSDYAFRNLQSTRHLRMLPFALWKGEPLAGKTIVIAAEQGLGDQVMFASCLPDVLAMKPKRVIVEVMDRVAPTLARSFPDCEVIATKQDAKLEWVRELTDVDCFAMIADLPGLFRRRREDFPNHRGYFKADPARVAHWRARLDEERPGTRPRIGITWRGGVELTRKSMRSMKITDLKGLTGSIDATWVCLQYGDVGADLESAGAAGMKLAYWPEAIKDLDEFSALICALDLVVTVCNTTVHYAGALGKEVWVMTPKVPEWRYGLSFQRMPWYPSSRLFRQIEAGEWDSVLSAVETDLQTWLGARR